MVTQHCVFNFFLTTQQIVYKKTKKNGYSPYGSNNKGAGKNDKGKNGKSQGKTNKGKTGTVNL